MDREKMWTEGNRLREERAGSAERDGNIIVKGGGGSGGGVII